METSFITRADTSRHDAAALEEARSEALRDADELAEFLSTGCYRYATLPLMPLLRDKTAEDFADWSVAALLALLFDAGQPAQTTVAARDALASRYCEKRAAHITIQAAEISLRMAEDARYPEAA